MLGKSWFYSMRKSAKSNFIALLSIILALTLSSCASQLPDKSVPSQIKTSDLKNLTLVLVKVNESSYYIKIRSLKDEPVATLLKKSCLESYNGIEGLAILSSYKIVSFSDQFLLDIKNGSLNFIPSSVESGCMYDFIGQTPFNLLDKITINKEFTWSSEDL